MQREQAYPDGHDVAHPPTSFMRPPAGSPILAPNSAQKNNCHQYRQIFHAFGRTRQADLGEARTDRRLSSDERRAAGRAALLAISVREQRAFLGKTVDVRRSVPPYPLKIRYPKHEIRK
jgi:hypothetical protein